jgi:hypothetical protein
METAASMRPSREEGKGKNEKRGGDEMRNEKREMRKGNMRGSSTCRRSSLRDGKESNILKD